MVNLKVLDLFAGLGGATQAFRERGHDVVGIEKDGEVARHAQDGSWDDYYLQDVRDLARYPKYIQAKGPFDFVWASPPCPRFSKITIRRYWDGSYPDHPETWDAISLVYQTIGLIRRLEPDAWILENPAGKLRSLEPMARWERRTVTYCQYGEDYRKETDLWGGFPPNLNLEPPCKVGSSCHRSAPRNENGWGTDVMRDEVPEMVEDDGSRLEWSGGNEWGGDRGEGSVRHDEEVSAPKSSLRSKVPYELGLEVCRAVEGMRESGLTSEDGKLTGHGVEL